MMRYVVYLCCSMEVGGAFGADTLFGTISTSFPIASPRTPKAIALLGLPPQAIGDCGNRVSGMWPELEPRENIIRLVRPEIAIRLDLGVTELPVLKIFLSSPGDVSEERALAEFVFRRVAAEVAHAVRLTFVIWEHEPLFGHTGFQQQIERPSNCDLVVSILWSRLGTRLPSDFAFVPGEPAPTGTEFEIRDALAAHARHGRPKLLIYRKVPGPQIGLGSEDFSERSNQFRSLEQFCQQTFFDSEGAVIVAHHTFTDSHTFERRLGEHVRRWLDAEIHVPHLEGFRPFWRGESPFRGLQSFEAEHQAIYFGRSEAMSDLMRRIRETETAALTEPAARLLLVQGMSARARPCIGARQIADPTADRSLA